MTLSTLTGTITSCRDSAFFASTRGEAVISSKPNSAIDQERPVTRGGSTHSRLAAHIGLFKLLAPYPTLAAGWMPAIGHPRVLDFGNGLPLSRLSTPSGNDSLRPTSSETWTAGVSLKRSTLADVRSAGIACVADRGFSLSKPSFSKVN